MSCSSPGPGRWRSGRPTWSSWSGRRSTSGSATASSAARTARRPAVVHVADAPGQVAAHCRAWPPRAPATWPRSSPGWPRPRSAAPSQALGSGLASPSCRPRPAARRPPTARCWPARPTPSTRCGSTASWPGLADDAVVIGDGGDFVSYAGKFIEPSRPGGWLDPGPYGCLGTGLGYAIAARLARPSAQVVLLLGDGAAGFSLMDADTLVRHRLPVVMVCGNNGIWGLEKHPMQALYGYDVAADLQPQCRYDEVVSALGGAGELVTRPGDIGPGAAPGLRLRRALPGQRASPTRRSPTPAPPPASAGCVEPAPLALPAVGAAAGRAAGWDRVAWLAGGRPGRGGAGPDARLGRRARLGGAYQPPPLTQGAPTSSLVGAEPTVMCRTWFPGPQPRRWPRRPGEEGEEGGAGARRFGATPLGCRRPGETAGTEGLRPRKAYVTR